MPRQRTAFASATALALVSGGCAAGRNETTGGVVVGLEVARLTETTNQLITSAADALFGPAGVAVSGGVLGFVGLAGRWLAKSAAAKGERAGWDEAQQAANAARERELAAYAWAAARQPGVVGPAPAHGPVPDGTVVRSPAPTENLT